MEEKNLEQLEISAESEMSGAAESYSKTEEGSMLGKFKDAESLLAAYNNLEAEFTRKSQKLAELQKKLQETAVFEHQESIEDFIENAPNNDKYKKEITEILEKDKSISNLPNKFDVALSIIKNAEQKSQELLTDEEFLEKNIYSNKRVVDKIISNYLNGLNGISAHPKLISGSANCVHFSPDESKPKTIFEAGEILSKMLK